MSEALFAMFVILLGIIGVIVGIGAGVSHLLGMECLARGAKMQIETHYSFSTGCMINIRGAWLPWSEVIPVEVDGKIVFRPKPVVRFEK